MYEMSKSSALSQVEGAARTVPTVQEELNDAIEVRNSVTAEAVDVGATVAEVAERLGVTVPEVDKMIAADRERVRKWREEQQPS